MLFGHFEDLGHLKKKLKVFQSFFRFWAYFYHLLGLRGIFVIYKFWGCFVFLFFFFFFLVLGGILVIFQVLGLFWSFSRIQGYFGNFLGLGSILVNF